ncbi:hypothetical protein DAPPUDRAFT_322846 [Daphnia pulex]|uniref:Uncharacterized protein n=1 Tax=Daphnia pulex TaxID=6669 RepID=E9GX39_DAPPU|nr:hypothetical protein DAPPUDRAFT_322846 [Daphnia pulex]|eukprot:EFX75932.1 hypothetical protein DAPPUDRAFT_322846 [Daphnia pulex]
MPRSKRVRKSVNYAESDLSSLTEPSSQVYDTSRRRSRRARDQLPFSPASPSVVEIAPERATSRSNNSCVFGHLVALFCAVVLGRLVEKDQQHLEDLTTNRDTLVSPQSRKTDSKLDVKIAHQRGQPDEPHTEMFSSPENVGKDAPEKSELIGEVKSELLELASVPAVPLNPALSSSQSIFGYLYYGAGYGSYGYGDYAGGYYNGYGDYG